MSQNRAVIYISEIIEPIMTMELQEKLCRSLLQKMDYENITVFKDEKNSSERFEKMLSEINYYDILVIFSIRNLGRDYLLIINNIKRILKNNNAKFLSFIEPNMKFDSLGEFFSSKSMVSAFILGAVSLNKRWEDMAEYYEEIENIMKK